MKINKDINYYECLELRPDVDPNSENYELIRTEYLKKLDKKDFKLAYRELSKQYHPDKTGGDDSKFKMIAEAYKVLSNPIHRDEYDKNSKYGIEYDENIELYNFEFSNENINTDKYQKDLNKFKKKELVDILIKMEDFQEVVEYDRLVICKTCDGYGMDFEDHLYVFECDLCEGSGEYKNEMCPSCKGKGESSLKQCPTCSGNKVVEKHERVKLNRERVVDGKLKVEFKGNASKSEPGKIGHLYVIIKSEYKDEESEE